MKLLSRLLTILTRRRLLQRILHPTSRPLIWIASSRITLKASTGILCQRMGSLHVRSNTRRAGSFSTAIASRLLET
ncbi:hypothetical protein COCCADRAFT_111576 [Bipolaris zeicola 26-R-13]|uniref:Uncharacterized protein n=1 Tax=Cochliobolus carbonum (strain 26-R-13) TaxID=930089 RepID=W6XQA2_COCC2|nr:uncharacterized protein COCCADRAFT_111576 [Bipolaris zeicola 26-R-13]EUC27485.1 hypothetical protein COCCADRAFT_111576 [Bipolaris zeicola 26-R-13]